MVSIYWNIPPTLWGIENQQMSFRGKNMISGKRKRGKI
jgi:hypothetical protein